MSRLLFICCLLAACTVHAQYNPQAPWMVELEKKRAALGAKTDDPVYTLNEISDAFNSYWEGRDWQAKGSGYKPFKRWQYYWSHFQDTQGYLPGPKDLWAAWEHKRERAASKLNPSSDWSPLGPFRPGIFPGQLPGTGRLNAIAVDPNDPNTWYIGAPAGGIWKSENAGESWINLFDDFPQIGVSAIAIDPGNSDIIYIATGDDDAFDSYSIGVFKSTDGGLSWETTGLNPDNTDVNTLMTELLMDPTNPDILWLASSSGLYKSIDAGVSWELLQEGYIADLKLKPGDPLTVYAVSNVFIRGGGGNTVYYKTTNGRDFEVMDSPALPAENGRVLLGVTPADPEVLYVLSAKTASQNFSYKGLYKSTDAGESFSLTENSVDLMESNQAWFDLALEVSPDNADEIYVGCLNIWKSLDGGDTFSKLNEWFVNDAAYTHADIHTLKTFNGTLFACTDGGLYTSEDRGETFSDRTGNAAVGQFYRLSVANTTSGVVTGGLQDNGGQILGGNSWNNYHGGDGMDNVIDPKNSSLVYGFTQFGGSLNLSTDGGQSIGRFGPPINENDLPLVGNWITPLAIDSEGGVYAAYDAIYKFNGSDWDKVSIGLGLGVEDLEISATDPLVMYAAQEEDLFFTSDGGASFAKVATFASPIADVAVNTENDRIAYVVTSSRVGIPQRNQPGERGIFRVTVDGGDGVVEDLTRNLPPDQAYFCVVHQGRHPDNPIYVGTSLGVYRLDDTIQEWENYFNGLPNLAISDLSISLDDEQITASTYGRGIWRSPIPVQRPARDLRLLSVSPEQGSVLCGEVLPEITVENRGTETISQVAVSYRVNGGDPTDFTADLSLGPNEIAGIPLPAVVADTDGSLFLEASATVEGDAYSDNNSGQSRVYTNGAGTADTVNDFETPQDALVSFDNIGPGSEWELGVPTGAVLGEAASGSQVYGTNLDGDHDNATKSFLLSPCYDLSSMLAPVLEFNMAYELELNFDIFYVQYSTDQGATWKLLGSVDSQPNWYNSNRTNASSGPADDCQNCPGGQWTGTNSDMSTYSYNFLLNAARGETDLSGAQSIVFRLVFHSDPFVVEEGVVVDDLVVRSLVDDDDDDNDGVPDAEDNCPLLANAGQEDADGDGIGDTCDPDDDNDGIPDAEDNCPLTPNPDQADLDSDGIGDLCDEDIDNDGVPNASDSCPDTAPGAVVDVSGCTVFSLPPDTFRVLTRGESCRTNDDGAVSVEAKEALGYTATLIGGGQERLQTFASGTTFENLASGNYSLCIEVEGQQGFRQCFDLSIPEPEPLGVQSKISSLDAEVELELSGGTSYVIELNGKIFRTSESSIRLPLDKPSNTLQVRTDLGCQGVYSETIVLQAQPLIYPNPVGNEILNIYLGPEPKTASLRLFTLDGRQVFAKRLSGSRTDIQFDMNGFPSGVYILNVRGPSGLKIYKIVKK